MPMSLLSCSVRRFKRRGKRASVSDDADAPLFPPEESCAQAESNAAAWILAIAAYLKERGGNIEDCVSYHGRSFAPAWEVLRGSPVEVHLVPCNSMEEPGHRNRRLALPFAWSPEVDPKRSSVRPARQQVQPLLEMIDGAEKRAGGELLFFGVALASWSVSAVSLTLKETFNAA